MNPRVVISLTTIPSRLNGSVIENTIRSVTHDATRKVDAVYLGIPKHYKKLNSTSVEPSETLRKMCTIVPLDKDYGPICKLYTALLKEHDKDTIIITIDDDIIYPPTLVEELLFHSLKFPLCSIGSSGTLISSMKYAHIYNESFHRYRAWHGKIIDNNCGIDVDYLLGYAGVLLKRGMFPDNEKDFIPFLEKVEKDNDLFYNDDVTIGAYLSSKRIPKKVFVVSDVKYGYNNGKSPNAISASSFSFYKKLLSSINKLKDQGYYKELVPLKFSESIVGTNLLNILIVLILLVIIIVLFIQSQR